MALYLLDWNSSTSEQVDVFNATNGQVLDRRSVSSFQNGEYLVWNLTGDVQIRITNTSGSSMNAMVSGLFFDAATAPTAPPEQYIFTPYERIPDFGGS